MGERGKASTEAVIRLVTSTKKKKRDLPTGQI
jgi:hypothetical protein